MDHSMNRIPKKIHFYWSMDRLCYLQYLTIVSFHRNNPEFEINIHYPCKKSEHITWDTGEQTDRSLDFIDYLDNLKALPYVKWHEVDMTKICNFLDNDSSEVFKSDFFRMHILSTVGGFWSDIDILFYHDIGSLLNYKEGIEALLCCDTDYYIGFMGAPPDSKVFRKLATTAEKQFNKNKYQSIGSELYKSVSEEIIPDSTFFHPISFYPFDWKKSSLSKFYYSLNTNIVYESHDIDGDPVVESWRIQESTGVHWCNGNKFSEIFCRYFNHTNQTEFFPTTLGFIMNKVFATDENYYSNSILQ